jgi:flagellar basal-body rod modification protein FlgD
MDTTPIGAGTAGTSAAPASTARTKALTSDFETFLKMLTVQMKNQDPLNPMEATDFAVQLATFSGVEQQVKTNDLLTRLADGLGNSGMADLAGWIGKEVRSAGNARFDGVPLTLYPEAAGLQAGESAFLVVRDEDGDPVARYPVAALDEPLIWAGAAPDGTPMPTGLYGFGIEVMNGNQIARNLPVEHYARVSEVRSGTDGPVIVTDAGVSLSAAAVTGVRAGGP